MTNTKMVMAEQENVVVVAHRDEYISDDEKDPEICRFKNIQTFPFGHRREVTCLDMDEVFFKKEIIILTFSSFQCLQPIFSKISGYPNCRFWKS